jgi:hypothetical protein
MKEPISQELIFVYNANSGVINSWLDTVHKLIKPETYSCDLCALTHGSFREKRIWKNFKQQFEFPISFYHKDEFLKKYKSKWLPKYEFPIVLTSDSESMHPLISASEFSKMETLEDLIERLKALIPN